jgi:hypothetical protein
MEARIAMPCYNPTMFLLLACTSAPVGGSSAVVAPLDFPESEDSGTAIIVDTGEDTGSTTEPDPVYDEPDPPDLLINEVQTRNASTLLVSGTFPDWIEVYNGSAESVALSRISVADGNDLPWHGPADEVLAPGGYMLLYADSSLEGGMHAPFSFNGDGDQIVLKVDGYAVDRIATGELPEDASWARFPDGGSWAPTITCTPGETNGDTPSESLDPGDALFDLGFNYVGLTLTTADKNTLTSNSYAEVPADVDINGAAFGPVDLRIRGSATRRSFGQKASLKVDLNPHIDIKYRGLEKLTLINMIWDGSYIREEVGYAIFREAGVPAARTSYTWLDVNGENYGIYLFTETYDDAFLRHWFGSDNGYLWEANGDFSSPSSWDCEEGYPCDTSNVSAVYTLIRANTATTAGMAKVEAYIALDSMMREWIIENAIGQWDGYTSPHNYRIYHNLDDGLMYMIPSSIDYTFDNPYQFTESLYYGNGALMRWCFATTDCRERYNTHALEVADLVEEMDWDTRIDEMRELLDDHVGNDQDDPQGQYSSATYETQVEYVRAFTLAIPDWIRGQVD